MDGRTPKERAIDNLLLLYAIAEANERGKVEGITKLTKLIFKAENNLQIKKIKGFNYPFIKHNYGPWSFELECNDYYSLVEDGFISQHGISLTRIGKRVLKEMKPVLQENKEILSRIRKIIRHESTKSLSELKDEVYKIKMKTQAGKLLIENIPKGTQLLINLPEESARKIFKIDEDWLETLMTLLNIEEYNSLQESQKEAKKKKALSYEKVFGS